jgi:hypothetical protein
MEIEPIASEDYIYKWFGSIILFGQFEKNCYVGAMPFIGRESIIFLNMY